MTEQKKKQSKAHIREIASSQIVTPSRQHHDQLTDVPSLSANRPPHTSSQSPTSPAPSHQHQHQHNHQHSLCLAQVLVVVGRWLALPATLEVWHVDELVVKGQTRVGRLEHRRLFLRLFVQGLGSEGSEGSGGGYRQQGRCDFGCEEVLG